MRSKKTLVMFVCMMGLIASLDSCEDWGKMDPPAADDVYPTRQKLVGFAFNENASLDSLDYVISYDAGAEIVYDDSLYNQVLHVKGAQVRLTNPFDAVTLQNGAGFTFWLRMPNGQQASQLLSLPDGTSLLPITGIPGLDDGWQHFVGVQIKKTGFAISIDGETVMSTNDADNTDLITSVNHASAIIVGQPNSECWIDDITFVRNQMTEKDVERPTIKKGDVKLPDPVYLLDFNSGLGEAEIIGSGSLRADDAPGFGSVFQNVAGNKSTNYLRLPAHTLSHSDVTQQMTIGFWVNAANAGTLVDYTYSPFFTAYANAPTGANGMPMMALQSRGPVQLNCNGWSDFTSANHVEGKVNIYHQNAWEAGDGGFNFVRNWLDDENWHYYTITLTPTEVIQYMDGEVTNHWLFDPNVEGQQVTGLFSNGSELVYPCLGGNQAWTWGDPDAGFAFDDFVVYDVALTHEQVQQIVINKAKGGGIVLPTYYYRNNFDDATGDAMIVGAGEFVIDQEHGKIFQNVGGTLRKNYLLLPEDALAHSADTKELSIAFWVNAANAGEPAVYTYAPLFTAYSDAPGDANGTPMMAIQSRGPMQINCNGWCDFTSANHVNGKVNIYNENAWEAGDAAFNFVDNWLADNQWHLFVATFTETHATIWLDGEVKNEWQVDGVSEGQVISGLFSNGADLKYVCLGGNQAWAWGDNDAGFAFDDIMLFDFALTASDIQVILSQY